MTAKMIYLALVALASCKLRDGGDCAAAARQQDPAARCFPEDNGVAICSLSGVPYLCYPERCLRLVEYSAYVEVLDPKRTGQ
jgi:hypothetical protein